MKKLVYVTGAGRGIGQAIALRLAQDGFLVTGCARSQDQLNETKKLSENKIRVNTVDVTDLKAVQDWIQSEAQETGAQPWGLVSAAGIYGAIGSFAECSWEEWKQGIETNLFGTASVVKCFSQKLMELNSPGRIVLMSGGGATKPIPNFSSYCAAKAAVVRFGETVAHELKNHHITVNSIAPGAIFTSMTKEVLQAGASKAGKELYESALKQKDGGGSDPEKATSLISYLMGPNGGAVTGRLIAALWDEWDKFHEWGEKLDKSDVFTLRRIVPEDRKL